VSFYKIKHLTNIKKFKANNLEKYWQMVLADQLNIDFPKDN
jgi:cytoplasmic iron level regulating protein YaaA (DUF328/UPF0246 family)